MDVTKKVCLIGDFGDGKTSLVRCFVDRQFSDQYLTTVGVKISRKQLAVPVNEEIEKKIQLVIWDIEGHTKYKSIAPSYLQGARGAIIVADLKRPETIKHITAHLDLFASVNSDKAKVIVALNKSDLIAQDLQYQLPQYPQVLGTYPTSAKTNHNVDQVFAQLACSLIQ